MDDLQIHANANSSLACYQAAGARLAQEHCDKRLAIQLASAAGTQVISSQGPPLSYSRKPIPSSALADRFSVCSENCTSPV